MGVTKGSAALDPIQGAPPLPLPPAPLYHGHHGAGAHVADEGWVEGLPL